MPLIELDRYLIRKGHGIFNLHEFIDAMLGTNTVEEGYAALNDSHHDLNHDNFAGVEADAVKIATSQGLGGLTEEDIAIINQGEAANPKGWFQAFQKAVNAGAPEINAAIKRTNDINRQKANAASIPFREIPEAFQQDMGNYVAVEAWRSPVLGRKGEGSHNQMGALVTQYVSKLTGKPEAYARPYAEGLQMLRGEKYPDLKMPKASDEISPNILHSDSLYIRDGQLRSKFALTVQGIKQAYPTAHPEQLKGMAIQALRSLPEFAKFAGIKHGGGLQFGEHSETSMQQRSIEQQQEKAGGMDNTLLYLHPDHRNATYIKQIQSAAKHYFNEGPKKDAIAGFKALHGWDEETTRKVYERAKTMTGKNKTHQLALAVQEQEMLDGKPPEWAGDAMMPKDAAIQSPVEGGRFTPSTEIGGGMPMSGSINTEQPPINTEIPPIQQVAELPPHIPRLPDPESPKPNSHTTGANPVPVAQKPPAPPMQSLNAYPSPPPANQNTGRGFMDNLLTRLGYGYETLFPSFGKSEDMSKEQVLKEMLENVQLEIAKKEVVETSVTKSLCSISSIADVATIAKRMKRSNSDIVSIYHSRGDWENVAKSFKITHKEVQAVKVIFNE